MADVCQCCCSLGREFKSFALQGNVLDLAIGIIIGTAFQNVVKSLVDDIITPPFGLIFDGVDFSNLTIKMTNFVHKDQPPVVIRYGLFLQQIIHLLVMSFALFCIIKLIQRLRKIALENRLARENQENNQTTTTTTTTTEIKEEILLLRDIRTLLLEIRNSNLPKTETNSMTNLIHL